LPIPKELFNSIGDSNIFSRTPKLLDRLKYESEVKTTKEQGVGARSFARNTLGIEGCVGALGWD